MIHQSLSMKMLRKTFLVLERKIKLCIFIGYYAFRNDISQKAIVVDPVGGALISIYVIKAWIGQANRKSFDGHLYI